MVKELARIVQGDGRNILSSGDIRELIGILNSLIVIYRPQDEKTSAPEARQPVRAKKVRWWEKFTA